MSDKSLLLLLFVLLSGITTLKAEGWTYQTINVDGHIRQYKFYVPRQKDTTRKMPMLIGLHGLGDNYNNFSNRADFTEIADKDEVVLVYPNAITDTGILSCWAAGAGVANYYLNDNIDDIKFISKVMDTIEKQISIDTKRIYTFGFSMGGFMAFKMGCALSDRLAAIAVVAGTIGNGNYCNPGSPVPLIQFHGTADKRVGYSVNFIGRNVQSTLDFWAKNNKCNMETEVTEIPHTSYDTFKVTRIVYKGDYPVVHYKIDGAAHIWLKKVENDIDYLDQIWEFVSQYRKPD